MTKIPRPSRQLFAKEFNEVGSTIKYANRFADHARTILVDEQNYLGLFALDTVLINRKGTYRKCGITPKANHPILLFFQVQSFHENDKDNPRRKQKYLPDRPDLYKIAALLHDEGEDITGFTKEHLIESLNHFITNIYDYVTQHNIDYPDLKLPFPTPAQIQQMRLDVNEIALDFDALTKRYKGQKKDNDYYQYHKKALKRERAAVIKVIDKACNAATFAHRSKEMIVAGIKEATKAIRKYRQWIEKQFHQLRDIYFIQDFKKGHLSETFNSLEENGFINAAIDLYPNSKPILSIMRDVLQLQTRIYSHNIANEDSGHRSPMPPVQYPAYSNIALSDRIDLLKITLTRLQEVARLDSKKDRKTGMFDIPFPKNDNNKMDNPKIPLLALKK